MPTFSKFITTCEVKGSVPPKKTEEFDVWALDINDIKNRINCDIYEIISIQPTLETMETLLNEHECLI